MSWNENIINWTIQSFCLLFVSYIGFTYKHFIFQLVLCFLGNKITKQPLIDLEAVLD